MWQLVFNSTPLRVTSHTFVTADIVISMTSSKINVLNAYMYVCLTFLILNMLQSESSLYSFSISTPDLLYRLHLFKQDWLYVVFNITSTVFQLFYSSLAYLELYDGFEIE